MRKKVLLMSFVALGPAVMHVYASLSETQAGIVWTQSAFSPSNIAVGMPSLYLGADKPAVPSDGLNALVLARASLSVASGTPMVKIDPLAPANVTNDAMLLNNVKANSPLNGQPITNIALQDSTYPIVTIDQTVNKNVYLVTKPEDGTVVLTNNDGTTATVDINDAGGNPTNEVKALASGLVTIDPITKAQRDFIFAAVSANGTTWQDPLAAGDNRGIAILEKDASKTKLNVLDTTDFAGATNKAQKLSLAATKDQIAPSIVGPVAFVDNALTPGDPNVIKSAKIGANVDMFFDSNLQRLYMGLQGAARDADASQGGILGVVVGSVNSDATAFQLLPVIDGVKKDLFYGGVPGDQNINDRVVGFYADGVAATGDGPFSVSIDQINTMHTSTGKDYLVVNSNVVGQAGPPGFAGIAALPLIGTKLANGTTATPIQQIGTISKIVRTVQNPDGTPTFDGPPTTFDEMPIATDPSVTVGGSSPIADLTTIKDIFVAGDTVYIATADAASNVNSGIFASSAIFAQDGSIRAWTPVQRVMGSVEQVSGAGLDTIIQPGAFYALTSQSLTVPDANTVKITQWGTSDRVTAQQATVNNLSSVLADLFPLEKGGVLGLFSFDEQTPGFVSTQLFGMMVAVGKDTVALIQTVQDVGGQFTLIQNFIADPTDPAQNVFVFDGSNPNAPNFSQALADIMPLTGAEVSRMIADDSGWLFISGCNGIAVLSLDTGAGWTELAGLSKTDANSFPGGANWTFKQLIPSNFAETVFMKARKLVASDGRMYVETLNGVFFFDMEAGKFDGPPASVQLDEQKVAGLDGALVADLVVLSRDAVGGDPDNNNFGVIATNKGVYLSDLQDTGDPFLAAKIGDLALDLQIVGDQRSRASTNGNVYALATDFENNNDKLYRFDVMDVVGTPTISLRPDQEFNDTVQSFMTDGTFIYTTLPKNYGSTNYLTLTNVDGSGSADITPFLGLDLNKNTYISGVLRDGASGAIMVPGDWGVRVNE